jgi:16S rRNA (cytosine967-C5)-methyltransferase
LPDISDGPHLAEFSSFLAPNFGPISLNMPVRRFNMQPRRVRPPISAPHRDGPPAPVARPTSTQDQIFELAATVISESDRAHPADHVLRAVLKRTKSLAPGDSPRVAHAVFAYFRWFGWLEQRTPLLKQLDQAAQLNQRFTREPEAFPQEELEVRAVPYWTKAEMDLNSAWLLSLQAEPTLWLRARLGQGERLAKKLGHCRKFGPGPLSDILEYQGKEDLFRTLEFHAGEFEVQDISSQAVSLICSPHPGETWWDACAGEGGKTLHLSDLMENQGLIWATDRSAWRLQHLKRRAARARVFNYRAALWQEGPHLPTKTKFDGVLVDAPCSGLGTWQRNPHARWTTRLKDVHELATVQESLLAKSSSAVKPGGRLVYAVCTLARSETVRVAQNFEARFPEFEPVAIANPLKPASPLGTRIFLWPQDFGGNGMFVVVWKRRTPNSLAKP